jgi:hypothetical protein
MPDELDARYLPALHALQPELDPFQAAFEVFETIGLHNTKI